MISQQLQHTTVVSCVKTDKSFCWGMFHAKIYKLSFFYLVSPNSKVSPNADYLVFTGNYMHI